MIISRTPFRISFVGGGTDLPAFYMKQTGKVLSTSIDKYIYVVVKRQIGIVEYKYRINWSQVEFKNNIEEIEHPIVREALILMNIDFPIEVTTFADIPAGTGLGSSSAFAVGLLNALFALKGQLVTKYQLAETAAKIEINILQRTMGKQDHFAASYGNLNAFSFHSDDTVTVDPVFCSSEIHKRLEENLLLFYTGKTRNASDVLKKQNEQTLDKMDTLEKMKDMVDPLRELLTSGDDLAQIGRMLHENWMMKKSLTDYISSNEINNLYEKAIKAGAIGGKLLGAGAGGFLMFYVEQKNQEKVINALKSLYFLNIGLDTSGSRITYYDQTKI